MEGGASALRQSMVQHASVRQPVVSLPVGRLAGLHTVQHSGAASHNLPSRWQPGPFALRATAETMVPAEAVNSSDDATEYTRRVLSSLERRYPVADPPKGRRGAAASPTDTDTEPLESEDRLEEHVADQWAEFDQQQGMEASTSGREEPQSSQKQAGKEKKKKGKQRRGGKPNEPQLPLDALPKVAIVGRPNVGKSALFNRITGEGLAIVYDYPGVTRDRLYTRGEWAGTQFVVVDTGGLMGSKLKEASAQTPTATGGPLAPGLPEAVEQQAAAGVAEADALIVVVDGQAGLTVADEEVVTWLRRHHPAKPLVLAVNKCENLQKADQQANEFWQLGWEPIPVSAISGSGSGDLLDRLIEILPPPKGDAELEAPDDAPLGVAIVGRPNVGKSSLLNAFLGEQRAIVSPMAGTTRDSVDSLFTAPDGRRFRLVDTAGIRRRTAVRDSHDGAEGLSVSRAMRAVRRASVAVLVIDGMACSPDGRFEVTQQDFRLAEMIAEAGRACVIVVNKWDAVEGKTTNTLASYQEHLLASLRPVKWAGVVFSSATTGQRVPKILDAAWEAGQQHQRRIGTSTLNMVLKEATNWRAPPTPRGSTKSGRIYFITQADVKPPTFVCFVNDDKLFTDDYRKYIENQLRQNAGFPGTPLRLHWRGKPKRDRKAPLAKSIPSSKTLSASALGDGGDDGDQEDSEQDAAWLRETA